MYFEAVKNPTYFHISIKIVFQSQQMILIEIGKAFFSLFIRIKLALKLFHVIFTPPLYPTSLV